MVPGPVRNFSLSIVRQPSALSIITGYNDIRREPLQQGLLRSSALSPIFYLGDSIASLLCADGGVTEKQSDVTQCDEISVNEIQSRQTRTLARVSDTDEISQCLADPLRWRLGYVLLETTENEGDIFRTCWIFTLPFLDEFCCHMALTVLESQGRRCADILDRYAGIRQGCVCTFEELEVARRYSGRQAFTRRAASE